MQVFSSTTLSLPLALFVAQAQAFTPEQADAVIHHYADIAQANFEDSLTAAKALRAQVEVLLAEPTEANLDRARDAWRAARVPYQQTEAFRFGNPVVDDWEGRVNAWPLDEGLIDYVDSSWYGESSEENPFYSANLISSTELNINGEALDVSQLTPELLQALNETDGIEANVTTGYHAIEFMLWGQDLNGTGPGAGQRPASDFDTQNCSVGHCERRGAYLLAATDLLISDLEEMVSNWVDDGVAREALFSQSPVEGISAILTGMGSLSYGELAGERTKLGLMLHDPEEEHDCFSDNTHWSHFYDAKGIENVYLGRYTRIDGQELVGPSLSALIAETDAQTDNSLRDQLSQTLAAAQAMVDAADQGQAFDQLIAMGNTDGNQLVQTFVDKLVAQTRAIETAVALLDGAKVTIEGSDSLDNPSAIH